ncbi:MAG TPA: GntR family transcriptional regulator [Candidatus Nocardiopsis merdipullorum]|nr:GntR family transcriptional regulator [Candidatus Nocardiopsis merdipullorum]
MTPMPVDRTDSRPLHAQVADVLRAEIRDRSIPPGETLPSEAALRERFGVSRSVVRQALGTLIDEGTVHRARGRAPVAAAPTEHRRFVQRVTGMHDQFSSEGLDLATTVLSLDHVHTAPPAACRHLGTYDLLRLERLRSVGGVPLSRVRTWLPAARVAGLTTQMLHDASLHRVLRRRFGLFPTNARHQVRAVPADPRMAHDLDVPAQFPLLLLEGGTFDQAGSPLEWFESWHRSDRVVFDIEADDGGALVGPAPPPVEDPPTEPGRAEGADLDRARHLVEELREELERLRGRP